MEEALTEADDVMQFTETALGLQSKNVDEQTAAARKYTQMTDYVTSRIMESTVEPLKKVYVYTVELQQICTTARWPLFHLLLDKCLQLYNVV